MRFFAVTAEIIMGVILGIFLFAALIRLWPAANLPVVAGLVIVACILMVLFRQPNGFLAVRRNRR